MTEDNMRKVIYDWVTLPVQQKLAEHCKATIIKKNFFGVPVVAQWLTIPTGIREDVGLIPGLDQWVRDLALP